MSPQTLRKRRELRAEQTLPSDALLENEISPRVSICPTCGGVVE